MTDDLPLRGEIYDKLKFCAVNNIPRKITNILEVLKLEAQVPDFPPEQDRIHLSNGIPAEQQKTMQTVFGQFSRGHRSDRIPPRESPRRAHGTLQPVWMKVS